MTSTRNPWTCRTLLSASPCALIAVLPEVALAGQKPCAEPLLADAEIYVVSHTTDADAQVIIAGGDEEGITLTNQPSPDVCFNRIGLLVNRALPV